MGTFILDSPFFTIRSAPLLTAALATVPDWPQEHSPRLVCTDGALKLDTAFTRLTRRPPLMIAGMTPCTSLYGTPLVA